MSKHARKFLSQKSGAFAAFPVRLFYLLNLPNQPSAYAHFMAFKHELNPDLTKINWQHLAALIEKVGWMERTPEDIKTSFERSSFKVFVYDANQKVIAFGRTVDDGKFYAQLADIIVDPDHQGEHLGELVVKTLTEQLLDYHFITLTSATERADMFYRHLGWKKQSTAFIYPLSEKQIRLHVEPGE